MHLPDASIKAHFTGTDPRLDFVHFEYPGRDTPGRVYFGDGKATRDDAVLSWDAGAISMAIFFALYDSWWRAIPGDESSRAHMASFRARVSDYPALGSFWGALNNPTWVDDVFGYDGSDKRMVRAVLRPCFQRGQRSILALHKVMRPGGVIVTWDAGEPGDSLVAGLVETWIDHRGARGDTGIKKELRVLRAADGIYGRDAREYGVTKRQLDDLNREGSAARIRLGQDDLYLIPELGIIAALIEGRSTVEEICEHGTLAIGAVRGFRRSLGPLVEFESGAPKLKRFPWKCAIFDWSETLVREFELDEAVCEKLATGKGGKPSAEHRERFKALLESLEREQSCKWYDYPYLAAQCGKPLSFLKRAHFENASKMRALFELKRFLRELKGMGVRIGLVTDCHSEVLKWRMEMVGVSMTQFDAVFTSDKVEDVTDKEQHLRRVIKKLAIIPAECIVIGDSLWKDIAPAKALGFKTMWVVGGLVDSGVRGEYGSPSTRASIRRYLAQRANITGRVADYCGSRADMLLSVCRPVELD